MRYIALLLICFLAGFAAGKIASHIKKKFAKPDDDWHGGHWPH